MTNFPNITILTLKLKLTRTAKGKPEMNSKQIVKDAVLEVVENYPVFDSLYAAAPGAHVNYGQIIEVEAPSPFVTKIQLFATNNEGVTAAWKIENGQVELLASQVWDCPDNAFPVLSIGLELLRFRTLNQLTDMFNI